MTELGDLVRLKSGGPTMTVTQLGSSMAMTGADVPWYGCAWFHEGKYAYACFPEQALVDEALCAETLKREVKMLRAHIGHLNEALETAGRKAGGG